MSEIQTSEADNDQCCVALGKLFHGHCLRPAQNVRLLAAFAEIARKAYNPDKAEGQDYGDHVTTKGMRNTRSRGVSRC